jgi:lysophospholipase L1-like esterase
MKVQRVFFVIFFLLFSIHSASASNIVCLGDSITYGYSGTPYPTYLALLDPGDIILNKGIAGQTTAQFMARYPADVTANSPSFVIILGGRNDIASGISVTKIESNLQTMYTWAKNNGTTPIACTVMPSSGASLSNIQTLNIWIKNYAVANNIPFIDYYALMDSPTTHGTNTLNKDFDSGDNVHPNNLGGYAMSIPAYKAIKAYSHTKTYVMSITNSNYMEWNQVLRYLLFFSFRC